MIRMWDDDIDSSVSEKGITIFIRFYAFSVVFHKWEMIQSVFIDEFN
jgi:hypothetical protein